MFVWVYVCVCVCVCIDVCVCVCVCRSIDVCVCLTVMGHAQQQTLLEATVLTLVPALLLDLTAALTALILQLHTDGSPEEPLEEEVVGRREEEEGGREQEDRQGEAGGIQPGGGGGQPGEGGGQPGEEISRDGLRKGEQPFAAAEDSSSRVFTLQPSQACTP